MIRPLALLALAGFVAGCGDTATPTEAGAPASASASASAPASPTVDRTAALTALPAPYDEADLDNGRRVFARCRSCHTLPEGGSNMTGPNLYGVFGRRAGAQPGYRYSDALKAAGFTWDGEHLDQWLESPRTYLVGTKMSFAGIPDPTDRRDVIAYIKVETGYESPARP